MSGQFPYNASPQPAHNMATYNGIAPQGYGQPFPPGKSDQRPLPNGTSFGGPVQQQSGPYRGHTGSHTPTGGYTGGIHPHIGSEGFHPQSPTATYPPTTQFQGMTLNDPSKTHIRAGMPPTSMAAPPWSSAPPPSANNNGPSVPRPTGPPSSNRIGATGPHAPPPPTNIGPHSNVGSPPSSWSGGVSSSASSQLPHPVTPYSSYGVHLQSSSIGGPVQQYSTTGPVQSSSVGRPMQPSSIGGPTQPSSIGGPMQQYSTTGSVQSSSVGRPMQPSSIGGPTQPSSIGGPMQPSSVGNPPPGGFTASSSNTGNPEHPSVTNSGQYEAGFHNQGLPPSSQHQQQFPLPPTSMYNMSGQPTHTQQSGGSYPQQTGGSYPQQTGGSYPQQTGGSYPQQTGGSYPQQTGGSYPQQTGGSYPQQTGGSYPQQTGGSYPQQTVGSYPQQNGGAYPQQNGGPNPLPSGQRQVTLQPASGGQFPGSSPYGQQPVAYQEPQPVAQPQQQKRLNPDNLPSPIQVIEDDRKSRSGVYQTNTRGGLPPLVTTKFNTQDQGNSNPRFIRSTMYNIPCTADVLKSSHIPFVLALAPFAELGELEQPPPLVDFGALGPVRCKRCKAYISPFMQFIDGGRRFQCPFCSMVTDVPAEYFAHLDHTGRRVDYYSRPELCLGSYEFAVTKDYCKNGVLPKEPAFIFMIDVSYNSIKSGLVNLICDKLKSEILVHLPREAGAEESEVRVGFVTYDKVLHFYNVKNSLIQPHMMVVSDLDDVFVPVIDGFLVKPSECESLIDSLLTHIPQEFAESKETEVCLGPVIQAGLDALKSADRPGRLYIFHSGLPVVEAPGKLKNRDDRKLLGTDKEKTILTAQTPFYSKLGTDCVAAGCSVDLFLFPNQYIDVATLSDVCKVTSGNIFKYSYFQADIDGQRFLEDLKTSVRRSQAFDSILRVRTSTGIRPVNFYGNFYMANTTDVEMASVDSDSCLCVEVKHDDKLSEADGAFIQVAVLYTSVSGQRRLRCHNLSLNCCSLLADLFRSCELDVLINFFAKQALHNNLSTKPVQVREHITNEVSHILSCYRKSCTNPSSPGQLVLPECMKLLPLYACCVIKNDSISAGSEISTDDKSYLMHMVNRMDVTASNVFFYPRLLPVHNLDLESSEFPVAIRCSIERLEDSGIYLLENGLSLFVWIGLKVSTDLLQKVFGVSNIAQVDVDKVQFLQLDNPVSRKICELVAKIRQERSRFLKLIIVKQGDKIQPWFEHFLVEDKCMNSGSSYVDFLLHIHEKIRSILS